MPLTFLVTTLVTASPSAKSTAVITFYNQDIGHIGVNPLVGHSYYSIKTFVVPPFPFFPFIPSSSFDIGFSVDMTFYRPPPVAPTRRWVLLAKVLFSVGLIRGGPIAIITRGKVRGRKTAQLNYTVTVKRSQGWKMATRKICRELLHP